MQLTWHNYRYYPYERELALREVSTLLKSDGAQAIEGGVELDRYADWKPARRLTYFAGFVNGHGYMETLQARLEQAASLGKNRQATRYSVHGLHEYKGKFNPQVAKALLNIFGVRRGQRVLDPFCGSGTTLVECAHQGVQGFGFDINPLAVYIANAKLRALATPASSFRRVLNNLAGRFKRMKQAGGPLPGDMRTQYLQAWFEPQILEVIEKIKEEIEQTAADESAIFLSIASNLLRDYSLQDPHDLRIRRRKTALPECPFVEAFLAASEQFLSRLESAQAVLGVTKARGKASLHDVRTPPKKALGSFDAALTSPPYATALPYIDTQRLSLVWLNLTSPDEILNLDASLTGSREIRGQSKSALLASLEANRANIPDAEANFCRALQSALTSKDGFRRQSVPRLLYRYFAEMAKAFTGVRSLMMPNAPFGLIVGRNHTVLGGRRFDINTPSHLANLAVASGWTYVETMELQTYQRFGLHMSNATSSEALVVLRA